MDYFRFGISTTKSLCDKIERNLKFVCIILVIAVLCLLIAVIVTSEKISKLAFELKDEKERVCYTKACIKKASTILKNMNASVDPCQDFHRFACTNFVDEINIPDDQPWINSFTTFRNLVYREIRTMLEESPIPNNLRPLNLAKTYYQSCMNTSGIEADSLKTIKDILEFLGGWPLLQSEKLYDGKFDWKQTMYVLRHIGFDANYFLTIKVVDDLENSSRNIVTIEEGTLELHPQILLEGLEHSAVERVYFQYMVNIAILFGANSTVATEDLLEILNFETSLAKILPTEEHRQTTGYLYNTITVADLQKMYPLANWKKYLKYLLDIPNFQLSNDDVINLRVPRYLNELEDLLNKTSNRVQANYIMWRVVSSSVPYLTRNLRDLKFNFTKALIGIRTPMPRWKECANETLHRFWKPLKTIYNRKHFNIKSKVVASEMLTRIKGEFVKVLEATEFMDEETRRHALEKAKSFNIHIKPFESNSDVDFNEYYSELIFTSSNYLRNTLAVSSFNNNKYFISLREPIKDQPTDKDISLETKMYLPGGIFYEEFFDIEQPHYINYGNVGYLLGHLISHLFDDSGKNLDKNGKMNIWWTARTEENFKNKTACLIEKFGNYTIPEMKIKLDGIQTLSENVADSGGIKTAYLAYNAWLEENGMEQQLPGLKFTAKQMFWISLANLYCSKYRLQQLVLISLVANYVPCYYRIIGSFSNSEYFARDFNCPVGSPMNPSLKCDVW